MVGLKNQQLQVQTHKPPTGLPDSFPSQSRPLYIVTTSLTKTKKFCSIIHKSQPWKRKFSPITTVLTARSNRMADAVEKERRILVAVDEGEESTHALSWCLKNVVSENSKDTLSLLYVKPVRVVYPAPDGTGTG